MKSRNPQLQYLLLCLITIYGSLHPAVKTDTIPPVATHAIAMAFGYVTNDQRHGIGDIEPFVFNPLTGRLENSGVITRLADLFNQNRAYILTNVSLFRAMIKWYPNINLDAWRCKSINDYVYLFVQNSLLPPENTENPYATWPDLQAIEPMLGVKIADKTTISTGALKDPEYSSKLSLKNLQEESDNILNAFWDGTQSRLFMTKADYATNKIYLAMKEKPVIPTWAFFMLGFGAQSESLTNLNGQICGVTVPTYKKIIDFFISQLNTGIVFVSSSYFPDVNLIATLKEDNNPQLKKLPFPLITSSITAAPILSGPGVDETHKYQEFFSKLLPPRAEESFRVNWRPDPQNFEQIISLACRPYRYTTGAQERQTTPAAIPLLRPANQLLFTPARFGGNVVILNDTLIRPNLEHQPLYLRELVEPAQKNTHVVPDTILLTCKKEFTRPLVLAPRSDKKLPTIIGINPGPYSYTFSEIDAQGAGISAVIDAFLRIPGLAQDRAFIIKKLHASNDIDKLVPVNRPKPERSFYELTIVHQRTGEPEKRDMILVKQFDCLQNCTKKTTGTTPVTPTPVAPATTEQKPIAPVTAAQRPLMPAQQALPAPAAYTPVAQAIGTRGEKSEIKWQATQVVTGQGALEKSFDDIIATIRKNQIPPTLELFAS